MRGRWWSIVALLRIFFLENKVQGTMVYIFLKETMKMDTTIQIETQVGIHGELDDAYFVFGRGVERGICGG